MGQNIVNHKSDNGLISIYIKRTQLNIKKICIQKWAKDLDTFSKKTYRCATGTPRDAQPH